MFGIILNTLLSKLETYVFLFIHRGHYCCRSHYYLTSMR